MIFLASNPIIESYFQSDLFGKAIFLALFLLSIVTWTLFIKKYIYMRNLQKEGLDMQERFNAQTHSPLTLEFAVNPHPFLELYSNMKKKTIELLRKNQALSQQDNAYLFSSDIQLLDAQASSFISKEIVSIEKDFFILSTIISLAPFLGLLGTVWGILLTFTELHANHLMEKSSMIMGGLSMALGTTVVGLIVAIPALIAYNYLKSATSRFETQIQDFGTIVLTSVELHYRKIDA